MIFETLGLSYIIPAGQCDLELTLTQKGWLGAIPFIGMYTNFDNIIGNSTKYRLEFTFLPCHLTI